MNALPRLLAAGALSLFLLGGPLAAQGVLLDARMVVALPPPGAEAVHVQITYRVFPEPATDQLPLSVLTTAQVNILSLRAWLDGQEIPLSDEGAPAIFLKEVRDHFSEGSVRLQTQAGEARDTLSLQLAYTVEGAWTGSGRSTLPLVVLRWIPAEPTPRTFLASVEVPEGFTIIESFPTSVLSQPRPGAGGTYEIGLQGVPALLVLRVVQGEGSFITLERALDLLVVLILLGVGALGFRYLRREER